MPQIKTQIYQNAAVLIVAAGRGRRAGEGLPKQYRLLGGKPVIRRTAEAFVHHPQVARVLCVIHPDDQAQFESATDGLGLQPPVPGGPERQDSVRLGLEALAASGSDVVLIHDAARPFVPASLITAVIDTVAEHGQGAVPALPVVDTLKRGHVHVEATVAREGLVRAQTPQGFPFDQILAAHRRAQGQALTDDAAVMEAAGLPVRLVEGAEENIKLTHPEDFTRVLPLTDIRTGTGFDVHRFEPGDHVWLCGIKLPHDQALKGHSDADVGLHALTDAILGALADGDIGTHFPPTDARWKGAASDQFLAHAGHLVAQRGGRIAHCDITLICERPKIGPHKHAMRARVAEILSISPDRVSVKATTTEQLGFTGRREGIAAQAAATIRLPE
ncbi:MAG: bifunctional 2-C-methyl-D-erythritol 4-phosphate cytidylyltransferase/2-C-methyl-D-erythritol 2,4-cyclodiphosphate synthase [Rhodothalassiaceae bacterium]